MSIRIHRWEELRDEFNEALILGNGASIAIDSAFSYSNLLAAARQDGLITPDLDKVFEYLESSDFEFVLTWLWHSYHVNQALGVDENRTTEAYEQLRLALVETVRKHHVSYGDIHSRLGILAEFMKHFDTVVSLNYDLVVYWAMLAGNDLYGTWFKDAFINGRFRDEWDFMRDPFNAEGVTMVFYPHGNLALATDLGGEEIKLTIKTISMGPHLILTPRDLLKEIMKQWADASVTPLFVAEGTTEQKLAAINRSKYLRSIFDNVLPDLGRSVAVYGWSASANDLHILRQVVRGAEQLAFSVTKRGGDFDVKQRCAALRNRIRGLQFEEAKKVKIRFYWSDSPGVWLHETN